MARYFKLVEIDRDRNDNRLRCLRGGMIMFIWLTSPTIGQVLVNLNLVTAVTCVQGKNAVCFTGGEDDYIIVTESLEDIYERIQSAEKRYRK